MKKVYITFSGEPWNETTKSIIQNAPLFGAEHIVVYDDKWMLDKQFYEENAWLWNNPHKRGFGWYAWKPYIIQHALSALDEGDIVLYADADTIPIAPLQLLYDTCDRDGGIMLFASEGHLQSEWCKRDCYVVMGQDEEHYRKVQAGVARFMLFQKGPWRVTQFLMEWLTYCVNPLANTFSPSITRPEYPEFIEHRAEQAIMTNLAHRYGLKLYREACEAGNGSNRDRHLYNQVFTQVDPHPIKVTAAPVGSLYFNAGPR